MSQRESISASAVSTWSGPRIVVVANWRNFTDQAGDHSLSELHAQLARLVDQYVHRWHESMPTSAKTKSLLIQLQRLIDELGESLPETVEAQTMQSLSRDEELLERHIEIDPHKPSLADAVLVDTGIPVWGIIAYLDAVDWNRERTAKDYRIAKVDVDAAVAYYRRHTAAIDARIRGDTDTDIV